MLCEEPNQSLFPYGDNIAFAESRECTHRDRLISVYIIGPWLEAHIHLLVKAMCAEGFHSLLSETHAKRGCSCNKFVLAENENKWASWETSANI